MTNINFDNNQEQDINYDTILDDLFDTFSDDKDEDDCPAIDFDEAMDELTELKEELQESMDYADECIEKSVALRATDYPAYNLSGFPLEIQAIALDYLDKTQSEDLEVAFAAQDEFYDAMEQFADDPHCLTSLEEALGF